MTQFRITRKFASDYKISVLFEPLQTVPLLDDWVIDVMRIHRKKVAIITHAKTLFTFLIPYNQAGGAKNIPQNISVLLHHFLCNQDLSEHADEVKQLFAKLPLFCKTHSRHILGHMNDFKSCIEAQTYHIPFDTIDWDQLIGTINNMPINVRPIGYTCATKLMNQLLSKIQTIHIS